MRKICFILFFFSISSFAQDTSLAIIIDSIVYNDSTPNQRKFTIIYHLQNLTNNPISFILNTNNIRPNATSSMSYSPAYRLYQGDEIINTVSIFNTKTAKEKFEKIKKDIDSKSAQSKNDARTNVYDYIEKRKKEISQNILNSIIKLGPKEIKNFSITLDWDKNRYSEYFDNEYYLDEKETHYFDLSVNLMKEEFKERVASEDFKKIIEDKSIIKGWVQSNKMKINFKE
ncbi:hypothetical protein [Flavobacterium xinjiangense]|uniref:DUF4412 domain-containing protein n=1 Tax=Flavobacterium xinjiangense TaxID=178356 RepID=A0A1M7LIX3_9FLAO|nr:hypothetical protein [Flavobacterium xinjiangense]SHM78033.1 hypothetical protein SAMN05216269_10718 [Flavobacterium xinjiangense]